MLSELYHIKLNLQAQDKGKKEELPHSDFGIPGISTKKTFHLILNENGEMEFRILRNSNQDQQLWTLKNGNHKFFPAFRPSHPLISTPKQKNPTNESLLEATNESLLEATNESLLEAINKSLQQTTTFNWSESFVKIQSQLNRISKWTLDPDDSSSNELKILQKFVEKINHLKGNNKLFLETILSSLKKKIETTPLSPKDLKEIQILLSGSGKNIQIIFDYRLEKSLAEILYTSEMKQAVLKSLGRENSVETKEKGRCSFTNTCDERLNSTFPEWEAKTNIQVNNKSVTVGFGKAFKPYSKFSDAKCNYRYGRADSNGFIINKKLASKLVDAGNQITSQDNYNVTWTTIYNGIFSIKNKKKSPDKDIIIAYPTFKIDKLKIINLIAPPKKSNEEPEKKTNNAFEEEALHFLDALKNGSGIDDVKKYIRVLLLRKISEGQVQLVYSEQYDFSHLTNSITKWISSGKNLPRSIFIPIPIPSSAQQSDFIFIPPKLLFPEKALEVFTYKWTNNGNKNIRLQSPPIGSFMDLFFQREGVCLKKAIPLLETLLPRIESLLMGAGLHIPRTSFRIDDISSKQFFSDKNTAYSLMNTVSILGTLLYFSNSNVIQYMTEPPYLFGQLLAGLDELHKAYCIYIRDGNIPPTLIGNSALGKASDSPEETLSELCERSRIYLAWAETVKITEKLRNENAKIQKIPKNDREKEQWEFLKKYNAIFQAKKLRINLQRIAKKLHFASLTNEQMTAKQKAHLFLGYLSKIDLNEEEDNNTSESPEIIH